MSDTTYSVVNTSKRHLIDVIDEKWITDVLSDDDIDVPKDMFLLDDEDDDEEFQLTSYDDKWNDLGLDSFIADSNTYINPVLLQQQSSTSTTQPTAATPARAQTGGVATESPQ